MFDSVVCRPYIQAMNQELDLLELGPRPAKCLKGENSQEGDRIVAGRAYRGLIEARRWNPHYRQWLRGRTEWIQEVLA